MDRVTPVSPFIRAVPGSGAVVGAVCYVPTLEPGWLPCDGSYQKIADYPDLYAVMGDVYCPPEIDRTGLWDRLRRLVGLKPRRMPNPDYRPGFFRLPRQIGRAHG